jgi:hypothetical protein
VHITTYKDFCRGNQNFNIPIQNEYQFSTQPNMVLQMNGSQLRLHRFPFKKNIGISTKELEKLLVLKKKIAFARNNSFRGYYL